MIMEANFFVLADYQMMINKMKNKFQLQLNKMTSVILDDVEKIGRSKRHSSYCRRLDLLSTDFVDISGHLIEITIRPKKAFITREKITFRERLYFIYCR